MRKIFFLMLIASLSVVSFGIIKYQELLVAAASNTTPQQVTEKKVQADSVLLTELNRVGIQVDRIGDIPRKISGASTQTGASQVSHSDSPTVITADHSSGTTTAKATETAVTVRYYHDFTVLMADYDRKINGMFSAAKNEYIAIPVGERTADKKMQIGMKYVDIAQVYESEADAQCEAMLDDFKSELQSKNIDHKIVDEVRDYYSQYKLIQKQYYMAKLRNN